MKKYVFLLMIFAIAINHSIFAQETLTIENGSITVKVIEGNAFVFPSDLASYGVMLTKTNNGYILKDTAKVSKGTIVASNITGPVVITSDDGRFTNNFHGNVGTVISGSGNVVITNSNSSTIIVNGKKVTSSNDSTMKPRILTITVPKLINLTIKGGSALVEIQVAVNNLRVTSSNVGDVVVASAVTADLVSSGTGDVTVKSVVNLGSLISSGTGDILVKDSQTVGSITVSGTGDVSIKAKSIDSITVSGTGDVYVTGNPTVTIYSKSVVGMGSIITN